MCIHFFWYEILMLRLHHQRPGCSGGPGGPAAPASPCWAPAAPSWAWTQWGRGPRWRARSGRGWTEPCRCWGASASDAGCPRPSWTRTPRSYSAPATTHMGNMLVSSSLTETYCNNPEDPAKLLFNKAAHKTLSIPSAVVDMLDTCGF